MPRTLVRCKPLEDVFASSDEDEKEMQVQLARMCVLFEDLMLEHAGARNTWRDDMGGHFLDRTARHALERMDWTVGTMEIYEVPDLDHMHNVRLKFAFDIVAGGLSRRMPQDGDFLAFARESFDFVHEAWGHAAQSMHTIVQTHLWARFG